jgi:hypothetical protein
MADDFYAKLVEQKNELIKHRRELEILREEKDAQLKHDLREVDSKIRDCVERIEEAQLIYHQELKHKEPIAAGYYWGRNKWRKNPEDYDMIILVTKPNRNGVQEWYMMSRELIGWNERKDYEYTLGEFIGEER